VQVSSRLLCDGGGGFLHSRILHLTLAVHDCCLRFILYKGQEHIAVTEWWELNAGRDKLRSMHLTAHAVQVSVTESGISCLT
jgi:hypothetical protein